MGNRVVVWNSDCCDRNLGADDTWSSSGWLLGVVGFSLEELVERLLPNWRSDGRGYKSRCRHHSGVARGWFLHSRGSIRFCFVCSSLGLYWILLV